MVLMTSIGFEQQDLRRRLGEGKGNLWRVPESFLGWIATVDLFQILKIHVNKTTWVLMHAFARDCRPTRRIHHATMPVNNEHWPTSLILYAILRPHVSARQTSHGDNFKRLRKPRKFHSRQHSSP